MKKINIILFSVLLTFITSLLIIEKAEAKSFSSVTEYAQYFKKYGSAFTPDGATVSTVTPVGLKYAIQERLFAGHLIFGGPETYTSIFGTSYGSNGYYGAPFNAHRFRGVTYMGQYPFASNNIIEDYPTDGETGKRNYVYWRGRESSLSNNYKPKSSVPWNEPNEIRFVFNTNNPQALTPEAAEALYKQWIDKFEDHYYRVSDYKKGTYGSQFTRTEPYNLWPTHSFDKKRQLAFIIQPPTSVTYGRFVEWHTGCSGICYDVYNIGMINGDDFVATKLDLTQVGTTINIRFTVRYDGLEDRELPHDAIDRYTIKLNGSVIAEVYSSQFGTTWKNGESKTIDVGNVDIGAVLGVSDILEVTATYNHDSVITEDSYDNNTITKKLGGKPPQVCSFGGFGEKKDYENMVCARTATATGTNADGSTYSYTYCAEYKCQVSTYSLAYTIDTLSDPARQDLMGIWSGNYYGHKNLATPFATESKPSEEKWKIAITSHNVPGIEQNKLKRVIRAGRSLQLYGTLEFEVRFESYTGESDLDGKVNKFVESLKKNLETHGEDMGDGELLNNTKIKKDSGQLDSSRAKDQGKYIENSFEEEPMGNFKLGYAGHLGCKVIDVYYKSYKFEIPIKSKNVGGKQQTSSKGDYTTSVEYKVQSKDTDFYSNINTLNGIHGLKLQLKIVGSDIDSAMSASKKCYTEPELLGVYGNIYDDVRVEDLDVGNDKDWNW